MLYIRVKIVGMKCASCEMLIEQELKKIPGVEKVYVNSGSGEAKMYYKEKQPRLYAVQDALKSHGYEVKPWDDNTNTGTNIDKNTKKDYFEIGAIFLVIMGVYLVLKQFDIVPSLGISENMTFEFVFLIGLVAAFSTCMAVTGGLLVGMAAKYNEANPHLTGLQRFRPHLYFNIGRIIAYTVLGGLVGALGSVFSLSPKLNGLLIIFVSLIMISMGLQLLKLFPKLRGFQPKMPKFIANEVLKMANEKKSLPFFFGASTFFFPCGFTQALQLYVLSKGDFTTGVITMLAFSLGTLPGLLSVSAISSFAKGSFKRYFLKFAGVLVIIFGLSNVNNGFNLSGVTFASIFQLNNTSRSITAQDVNVRIENGVQIAEMTVTAYDYYPNRFTVYKDIPVEWRIDGTEARGCGQVVTMPTLGITEYLPRDSVKVIRFTPTEEGEIPFNCTMGMMTDNSAFTVVSNTSGITGSSPSEIETGESQEGLACDPAYQQCVSQKLSMEVTREKGFYPSAFTVKKGMPVELEIDSKVSLGGCMSTMIIPEYNIAHRLKTGKTTLSFTPTKAETLTATCSMGVPLVEINVAE